MTIWRPHLDDQQERVLFALLAMQRQSWEQGVASHAMLDLGRHELAAVMARDAVTHQSADGRLAHLGDTGLVNSGAVGEAVKWAAGSGDSSLAAAYQRQIDWLLLEAPRAIDGTLFHLEGLREMWVDTIYMVVPLLVLDGENDAARDQFDGHRKRLFDESTGLYGWRFDEDAGRMNHAEHWGTGNGWVVAAVARALRLLGDRRDAFAEWGAHARGVIDACLALRNANGLFTNVLDDASTFIDGNVAQMLAYAILTGVEDGWLPPTYEQSGRSLVASARSLVDEHGFVQRVCGSPRFDRQGTSVEAQSFFLLATNAERRLDTV